MTSKDPHIVSSFSYPMSKRPVLEAFEQMAWDEGQKRVSQKIMELIDEYVEKHKKRVE